MIEMFGSAPYAPSSAVLEVIDAKKHGRKLDHLDSEALERLGIRESLVPRTLQTLRLLDLVDDAGFTTPAFSKVASFSKLESQAALRDVLRSAYAPVFEALDPTTASVGALENVFSYFQPPSQRPRMVTLFINLMKAAGMIPEDAPQTPMAGRYVTHVSSSGAKRTKSTPVVNEWLEAQHDAKKPSTTQDHNLKFDSGGSVRVSLDVDLFTLSKQDRDFVMDLIDRVASYRTDRPGGPRTR
ncbi:MULTISPECIES: DUF5343 domain-containing protein [unclassified Frondihabitans]|uniref:DUF5343 domain-containing protein n=1 Tax=unclassified Frondihabitans TaxID=2626248 RepID=UPI000F4F2371|nr:MULTISPECIES: DUF5343 domain-containing protein [unclassified Frondihabitans]RPE77588.1 hypothetical protein EDF37_0233 [Frondihabitans sp. PhB153]RPF07865.1 hypothetical protein EDF39_0234 [Frondihabitans sp. PhB161]